MAARPHDRAPGDRFVTVNDSLRISTIALLGTDVLEQDEIARVLIEQGVLGGRPAAVRQELDRLVRTDPVFAEVTGGVMFTPAVLEGTAWTAWVDETDAAEGFVRVHRHLSVMSWWLVADEVDLVDDAGLVLGPLTTDGIWLDGLDTDVVFGPPGWLDGLAGGWVTVAVVGGSLRWTPCATPPSPTARQVEALRLGFERASRPENIPFLDREPPGLRSAVGSAPLHEAIVVDRGAFFGQPVAPTDELLRAAGLEERSHIIAADGFDWEALHAWQDRRRLAVSYGLGPAGVDRLVLLLGACETFALEGAAAFGADGERANAAALLAALLDDGEVAEAFWTETEGRPASRDALDGFTSGIVALLDDVMPAGLGWLMARGLDRGGDAAGAADLVGRLATGRCTHGPLLVDAAGFAADRGDAATAYRLLRQSGAVDHAVALAREDPRHASPDEADLLVREVLGYARHAPRPTAGRNDRCPCGSGKKYKACHLGRETVSLADRSSWLYDKAGRYLRARHMDTTIDLTDAIITHAPKLYDEFAGSPFVIDLALHEDGVFEEFLASRGPLLPADEVMLGAQWLLVDRGVFEIVGFGDDRIDLHDIGRGEQITVVNAHPSSQTRVGSLMIGRPLPVGDTYRAFGGFISIPRSAVTGMLATIETGDAHDITRAIASWFAPPRLQNTDGDALVLHTMRWHVVDPGTVDGALRAAGLERDDRAPQWRLSRSADGASEGSPDTIVATVALDGDELVGEVNSDERAVMLRAVIAESMPEAVLIDDRVHALDDVEAGPKDAPAQTMPDDPGLRDAIAAMIVGHERRWLDESIPALGGRTPRVAAADPVGREELVHLLDAFPDVDETDFANMSARRLRSSLGL